MKILKYAYACILCAALLPLCGCDFLMEMLNASGSATETTPQMIEVSGSQTISAASRYKEINSSAASVTVDGLSSSDTVYVIKYNPTSENWNAAYTGKITDANGNNFSVNETERQAAADTENDNCLSSVFAGGNKRYDFIPARKFEENLHMQGSGGSRSAAGTVVPAVNKSYYVHEQRYFYVQDASDNWNKIESNCMATGTYCNIFVAAANQDNNSTDTKDELISEAQAKTLAAEFDKIYPLETSVFGSAYSGCSNASIIAKPEKISILIYDIGYDYDTTKETNGGVYGFFWAKDMFISSDASDLGSLKSNEDTMFYLDAYFLDCADTQIYLTLAHEFQHMLNFNNKSILKGVNSSTWSNEMMSLICEDMMQDKLGLSDSDGPKQRFPYFLKNGSLYGFENWYSDNNVYYSYANAYAFGAYLVRNYGGAALAKEMAVNSTVDEKCITDALYSCGYIDDTFDTVFLKFGQVFVNSNTSGTNSYEMSLNKTVSKDIDGVTYTFYGVDIPNYVIKYSDGSTETGPNILAAADMEPLYSHGFSVHKIGGGYTDSVTLTIASHAAEEKMYIFVK